MKIHTALTLALSIVLPFSALAEGTDTIPTIGTKDVAWDPTTTEAAATPEQKKMLSRGKVETITGEIVDVSCYLQLGKRGSAHMDCGKKCILNGQPIGIVDEQDRLTLIMPEEHHPRRDGTVSLREKFAELMGKTVTVTGMSSRIKGDRALFVKAAPVTPKK